MTRRRRIQCERTDHVVAMAEIATSVRMTRRTRRRTSAVHSLSADLDFLQSFVEARDVHPVGVKHPKHDEEMDDIEDVKHTDLVDLKHAQHDNHGNDDNGDNDNDDASSTYSFLVEDEASYLRDETLDFGPLYAPALPDNHPDETADLESSFCRNYSCCGINLRDMHELLHHYEQCHVTLLSASDDDNAADDNDDFISNLNYNSNNNNAMSNDDLRQELASGDDDQRLSALALSTIDSDLDSDSDAPVSAFDTSIVRRCSAPVVNNARTSSCAPVEVSYVIESLADRKRRASSATTSRLIGDVEDDLQHFGTINEEDLLLAASFGANQAAKRAKLDDANTHFIDLPGYDTAVGVNPDLVQTGSGSSTEEPSDEEIDVVGLDGGATAAPSKKQSRKKKDNSIAYGQLEYDPYGSSDVLAVAQPSGVYPDDITEGGKNDRPYRCTMPGCGKTYKNPNGLKYHKLHGHCGGDDDDPDNVLRQLKPYMCSFDNCYKRYKNLNGLKYHIEKNHGVEKMQANQIASAIVKKTNADYGITTRSVPTSVLAAAIRRQDGPIDQMGGVPSSIPQPPIYHLNSSTTGTPILQPVSMMQRQPGPPSSTTQQKPMKPPVTFASIVPALRTLLMAAALRANNPLITPTVITSALSIVDTGKLDPTLSQSAATTQILSQVMTTISSQTRIPVQDLIQQLSFKQNPNSNANTSGSALSKPVPGQLNGSGSGNSAVASNAVSTSGGSTLNKNVTK